MKDDPELPPPTWWDEADNPHGIRDPKLLKAWQEQKRAERQLIYIKWADYVMLGIAVTMIVIAVINQIITIWWK